MNILFFGSSTDSVIVLEKIYSLGVVGVVTQPPKPNPTPVEIWAKEKNIPVLSFPTNPQKPWLFDNDEQVIDTLQVLKADCIISASFGAKIPWEIIQKAPFGGLNVHPSLLPRWRGGDPVPWAILSGDHQIGVSIVSLSETFDEGLLYAQKKIPIMPDDTSGPLRTKLFTIGAQLLVNILRSPPGRWNRFATSKLSKSSLYARRLRREDGFEPWPFPQKDTPRIERKFRAFHPWPGLWTIIKGKRVKILGFDQKPTIIQIEGKNPKPYLSPT